MKHQVDLSGKSILITGGGRGIGLSIAETLKKSGAHVVIVARSSSDLESAQKKLSSIATGSSEAVACDITQKEDIQKACKIAAQKFGTIYGLVCAAGSHGEVGLFRNANFEAWETGIQVNVIGTALSVHTALQYMPSGKSARIVLFSGGGQNAFSHFSSYVTGKGGIWRFTETIGEELAPEKIYVNAIAPGAVYTQFLENLIQLGPDKVGAKYYQTLLDQKAGKSTPPEKAAELSLYLMSPASEGLYGKTLSAVWDPYWDFKELETMSKSDLFTFKRVIDQSGNTRFSK